MKDISGYEGRYSVTEDGKVWSHIRGKYLKPGKNKNGYLLVVLCINGLMKTFKIHRLVAIAYLSNTENKPQINHKNRIRTDNRVENLEWCTCKENIRHASSLGSKIGRSGGSIVAVNQLSKNGCLIRAFESISLATLSTGIAQSSISKCASGSRKTCGGFVWQYS